MRKCLLLLAAAASFPVVGSAQLLPAPTSPGVGVSNSGGTLSVIYGTAADTAAEGNDARIAGALQGAGGDASATNVTATGSTTARTLADRAADVINVRDFGAVCDGSTDDTTAINAALARARSHTVSGQMAARVVFPSASVCRQHSIL